MDSKSKPIFSIHLSLEQEDDDTTALEEPKCLCGYVRITNALIAIAILPLILDLVALYAAWDTIFVYFLTFSSIGTFTVLCVVISGLQEEKRKKIGYTKIWVVSKLNSPLSIRKEKSNLGLWLLITIR
uniref:Uncharacterized protein n=1 Tax=Parascaris equorum TaxID=6256 RepID=A0A914S1X1_PAREQ